MIKLHMLLTVTMLITGVDQSWGAQQETETDSVSDSELSYDDLSTFFRERRDAICTDHTYTWASALKEAPPSSDDLQALGNYPQKVYSLIQQAISLESSSEAPTTIKATIRTMWNELDGAQPEQAPETRKFLYQLFHVEINALQKKKNLCPATVQRT